MPDTDLMSSDVLEQDGERQLLVRWCRVRLASVIRTGDLFHHCPVGLQLTLRPDPAIVEDRLLRRVSIRMTVG